MGGGVVKFVYLSVWKKFTQAGNTKFERKMNKQNEAKNEKQALHISCAHLECGMLHQHAALWEQGREPATLHVQICAQESSTPAMGLTQGEG